MRFGAEQSVAVMPSWYTGPLPSEAPRQFYPAMISPNPTIEVPLYSPTTGVLAPGAPGAARDLTVFDPAMQAAAAQQTAVNRWYTKRSIQITAGAAAIGVVLFFLMRRR